MCTQCIYGELIHYDTTKMLERVTCTRPPSVASSPFNEVGPAIQDPDGETEGAVTFPV